MSTTPGPPPGGDPNYPPQPPPQGPPPGQPAGAYSAPPQPTQGYPQQQQGYGGGGGGGPDVADFARRHIRTPETKEFFKSSEFGVWLLTIVGVAIAGLSADDIEPSLVWILITILSFAYIISRGIAKAGTKHHDHGHDR